ncbi:MAG: transcriptional regulator [Devosia sp.]|uniref:3'-5' exonuclease n=1 Tax=Devosia sp. TaxID=1871048 RepID=UPI0026291298|nr:exonuclease domain-containing protein [Devosia sp.]MDB5529209.1 transcriptional regulator [Devosia sp.]
MHVFLDFEASSLNKQSYPIEVGWVLEDGTEEGHLIRPAPNWTDWDDTAQAVHGISREQLEQDGEEHDVVCARLVQVFAGNVVYASAPSWDGHWLSMLLRAAGRPRHLLRLKDTEEAFVATASQHAGAKLVTERIAAARERANALPVAHRAVDDARREWSIWRQLSEWR